LAKPAAVVSPRIPSSLDTTMAFTPATRNDNMLKREAATGATSPKGAADTMQLLCLRAVRHSVITSPSSVVTLVATGTISASNLPVACNSEVLETNYNKMEHDPGEGERTTGGESGGWAVLPPVMECSHDPHLGTSCPNMGLGREGVLRGAVHTIPAHQSPLINHHPSTISHRSYSSLNIHPHPHPHPHQPHPHP
jgi:hypothetical protein